MVIYLEQEKACGVGYTAKCSGLIEHRSGIKQLLAPPPTMGMPRERLSFYPSLLYTPAV